MTFISKDLNMHLVTAFFSFQSGFCYNPSKRVHEVQMRSFVHINVPVVVLFYFSSETSTAVFALIVELW